MSTGLTVNTEERIKADALLQRILTTPPFSLKMDGKHSVIYQRRDVF